MRKKILIDCDPGQDDAIALLLALSSPEDVDVLAVTTVAGNVPQDAANENARQIVEVADRRDVPVHAGCVRPLLRPHAPYFGDHGRLRGVELPPPLLEAAQGHAVDAIVEIVRSQPPQSVTLCATGPLTNVAVALTKDPELARLLAGIALVGGAIGLGNDTPAAEFNVRSDPHAAAIVLGSGANVTMFALEVCHQAVVHADWVARLARRGTPAAELAAALLGDYAASGDAERYRVFGMPLYDPCVIAWVLAPELFTGTRHPVEVELEGRLCQGRTVVDVDRRTGAAPSATVVTDVDLGALRELLHDRLGGLRSLDAGRSRD
jgi:purine nucleosidase